MSTREIIAELEQRDLLDLAKGVARRHHVTLAELLGSRHGAPEARARRELWSRVYELVPSTTRVGEIFRRDHSTVLNAIRLYRAEERYRDICDAGLAALVTSTGEAFRCERRAEPPTLQEPLVGPGIARARVCEPEAIPLPVPTAKVAS